MRKFWNWSKEGFASTAAISDEDKQKIAVGKHVWLLLFLKRGKEGTKRNHVEEISIHKYTYLWRINQQNAKRWHHEVKLMEVDTHEVFYDKPTYIYVEIPKFDKKETELVTMYDRRIH